MRDRKHKGTKRPDAFAHDRNAPPARPKHPAAFSGKPKPARPKPDEAGFRRAGADLVTLYGFHAVLEALRNKRRKLLTLYATEAAAERLKAEIEAAGVSLHIVDTETLARRLGPGSVHQGILLEARPLPSPGLDEITARSNIVLVLDQITDPHNVGAILRSAAAYDVDAVVTTERHAPELSGVLAKAASGALEHVAVIEVVNLARTLDELGDLGYLRVGLDSEAPVALQEVVETRPLALVFGAEGKGLRRLTRERCDHLARLDLPGAIKSLNVSNACAVALTLIHKD
ncbi:MAG: 23S rRNA (guanosine(2251)-2'-O)-methyltransferase RlmB [Beijerinckiaceae bacterium]|nr:MAG: 23S rRNA (guanosine(2251)-2'-O)-methyltransferase RlmB [Beijerinckiaceae bacterium]